MGFLLQEDGSQLLLEDGSALLLDGYNVYEKTGSANAELAGSGEKSVSNRLVKAGGAQMSLAGAGTKQRERVRTGGAVAELAGSGSKAVFHEVVKTGGAALELIGSGTRDLGQTHVKTGGARSSFAGSGVRASRQTYVKTGGARSSFAGSGAKTLEISDVSVASVAATSATIEWTTSYAATSQVEYGKTTAYGSRTPLSAAKVRQHSVTITGLTPGTEYHFRTRSTGSEAVSGDFSFFTPGEVVESATEEYVTSERGTIVTIHFDSGARRYSFEGIAAPDFYAEGLLITVGAIIREVPMLPGDYISSSVRLVLADHEGRFAELKANEGFRDRKIEIAHGRLADGLAGFNVRYTGKITDWEFDQGRLSIVVGDTQYIRFKETIQSKLEPVVTLAGSTESLSGSELTIPWRMGSSRGYTTDEVNAIIARSGFASAIVEKAGGVDAWITLTDGGRMNPELWTFISLDDLPTSQDPIQSTIIYGTVETITGAVPCTLVDAELREYLVARHECDGVLAVYRDGKPQDPESYEVSVTPDTRIRFLDAEPKGRVTADVSGIMLSPVDALRHVLETFGDWTEDDFNLASFDAAREDLAGWKTDFAIDLDRDKEVTFGEIVSEFKRSYNLSVYTDAAGKIAVVRQTRAYLNSVPVAASLTDEIDIVRDSFSTTPNIKDVATKVRWNYSKNYATDKYERTDQAEFDAPALIEPVTFNLDLPMLRDPETAQMAVLERMVFMQEGTHWSTFEVPISFAALDLNDVIEVTHFQGHGDADDPMLIEARHRIIRLETMVQPRSLRIRVTALFIPADDSGTAHPIVLSSGFLKHVTTTFPVGPVAGRMVTRCLARGPRISFDVVARENGALVVEGELRVRFYPLGEESIPILVDLRTEEEGGTFEHNGTTQFELKDLKTVSGGTGAELTFSGEGLAYFAFRLRTSEGGWSAWTDGNRNPSQVTDYCAATIDPAGFDGGPPAGFTPCLELGPTPGTFVVVVPRPEINGRVLASWGLQLKDTSIGEWREIDEHGGAAVVKFDGSAVPMTLRDGGFVLRRSSGFGFGLTSLTSDLILLDVRGGVFSNEHLDWAQVYQFEDATGRPTSAASAVQVRSRKRFRPQTSSNLRLKIVKPSWEWETEGYFRGGIWSEYLGEDKKTPIFVSPPIRVPVWATNIQARVAFENLYSHTLGFPTTGTPAPAGGCGSRGGSIYRIQDEGIDLPIRRILNFKGLGVEAADDPDFHRINVDIPGGDGSCGDLIYRAPNQDDYTATLPGGSPLWVVTTTAVRTRFSYDICGERMTCHWAITFSEIQDDDAALLYIKIPFPEGFVLADSHWQGPCTVQFRYPVPGPSHEFASEIGIASVFVYDGVSIVIERLDQDSSLGGATPGSFPEGADQLHVQGQIWFGLMPE